MVVPSLSHLWHLSKPSSLLPLPWMTTDLHPNDRPSIRSLQIRFRAFWVGRDAATPKEQLFIERIKLLHPGRLTWNIIMEVWKIIFL